MRRGSTPTNTFTTDIDLSGATLFVSYGQDGCIVIEKTGEDLDVSVVEGETTIVLELSQEDTLKFRADRDVEIQIRYVMPNGSADASNIIKTKFERIIKDGVIYP